MLSSGANVIIWKKMISSGANVIMVSCGPNVIIWCYHVMLSSGMITHPFLFFLKTSLTQRKGSFHGWLSGLDVPVRENFVLPWLLLSAQYKMLFSSPYTTVFPFLCPSPRKLGRRSCWVACLLAYVSG
jgi:hypothetical protein